MTSSSGKISSRSLHSMMFVTKHKSLELIREAKTKMVGKVQYTIPKGIIFDIDDDITRADFVIQ